MPTPQKTRLTKRADAWRREIVRQSESAPAYDRPFNRPRLSDALRRARASNVLPRFSSSRPRPATGSGAGGFRSGAVLNPSVLRDMRANTPVENRAAWNGRQRLGQLPYIFPIPPQRRVNPSGPRTPRPRVRGGEFTPKPIRHFTKARVIHSGAVVPPVGGLIRGAISIGTRLLRGSPVTGPTRGARISQAAAGPVAGVRRPAIRPVSRPRRGGSARTL